MGGDWAKRTGRAFTLSCPRCGGTVPLTRYHPSVDCPFCKHRWEIPTEQLVQLSRHNARVRGRQVRAEDALERAAASAEAQSDRGRSLALVIVSATSIMLAIAAATWVIGRLGLADDVAAALSALVASCLFFAGIVASAALIDRRRRAQPVVAFSPERVRCASCGGKQELAPGQVFESCGFCGSALLPGATVMARAEAGAEQAAAHAERLLQRSEQRRAATARSRDRTQFFALLGSLLLVPVVWFVVHAPPPMWVTFLGVAPALLVSWRLLSQRRSVLRWERRLSGVVSRLGATRLRDLAAVSVWWDEHWTGSITDAEWRQGACWLAYAADLEGQPLLLVLNAAGESERFPAFLIGRVAAWSPTLTDAIGTTSYAAAARVLEEQGFDLRTESAGFWFRASAATLERWQADATADAIATAFIELCRAARREAA